MAKPSLRRQRQTRPTLPVGENRAGLSPDQYVVGGDEYEVVEESGRDQKPVGRIVVGRQYLTAADRNFMREWRLVRGCLAKRGGNPLPRIGRELDSSSLGENEKLPHADRRKP